MSISEYVSNLLSNYESMKIETNHVADGSDKYGLFKSPSRDIQQFNDGCYEVTEYYQFMAKQKAVSNRERKEADEWLEDLTYWADDFPHNYSFPELDKGRTVTSFSITGNPYPTDTKDKEILYQMSLAITYLREREDN